MPATDSRIQERLARLRRDYVARLPDRLSEIRERYLALHSQDCNARVAEQLHQLLHKLAGSAGTFGCPDVSAAARNCDQLLRQLQPQAAITANVLHLLEVRYRQLEHVVEIAAGSADGTSRTQAM